MIRARPLIAAADNQKEIAAMPAASLAPPVRRKLSLACLIFAWICANGMVWNVVQVVAWARMFQQFSQVMPAARALEITLDGSAPCPLCKISRAAQDNERKQLPQEAALGASDKLLLACDTSAPVVLVRPDPAWPGVGPDTGLTRTEAVPVPPPRA